MIKNVIVNLTTGASRGFAGEYAVSVAEAFDAHLAGIAFAYDPVLPPTLMGGIPADFIESQRTEAEAASARPTEGEAAAGGRSAPR